MGGSYAACSSTKHEGKHACMEASRAAWLRELHDSSSNSSSRRSCKVAFVVIRQLGLGVSGKIALLGESVRLGTYSRLSFFS